MADSVGSKINHSYNTNSKLSEKQCDLCQHCDELNAELHKVKGELLSYEKVVSVLQEEIRNLENHLYSNDTYQDIHGKLQTREIVTDNNWNQVKVRHNKLSKTNKGNLIQLTPCLSNKYEILHNLEANNETVSSTSNNKALVSTSERQTKAKRSRSTRKTIVPKHKIMILGDSHARRCADLVQDNLNSDYRVSSFIKPSAQMSEIVTSINKEVHSLTNNDVIIIWGGVKDIGRNNTAEAIDYVNKFLNDNTNKNIVLLNSPHRHDLISTSCVNKEVINYNRQLREARGLHPNVKLLEIKLDRHHFTRHGLHLNLIGKKFVSQEVAMIVKQIFKPGKVPTSLEKAALLEENNLTTLEPNIDDKAESTKPILNTVNQVTLQLHGNLIPDNIVIQEPNLTDECIDKEYPPQHQEPLLGNDIESQNSNQNEMMIMESIAQQKRHCPAKRNTDFLWN